MSQVIYKEIKSGIVVFDNPFSPLSGWCYQGRENPDRFYHPAEINPNVTWLSNAKNNVHLVGQPHILPIAWLGIDFKFFLGITGNPLEGTRFIDESEKRSKVANAWSDLLSWLCSNKLTPLRNNKLEPLRANSLSGFIRSKLRRDFLTCDSAVPVIPNKKAKYKNYADLPFIESFQPILERKPMDTVLTLKSFMEKKTFFDLDLPCGDQKHKRNSRKSGKSMSCYAVKVDRLPDVLRRINRGMVKNVVMCTKNQMSWLKEIADIRVFSEFNLPVMKLLDFFPFDVRVHFQVCPSLLWPIIQQNIITAFNESRNQHNLTAFTQTSRILNNHLYHYLAVKAWHLANNNVYVSKIGSYPSVSLFASKRSIKQAHQAIIDAGFHSKIYRQSLIDMLENDGNFSNEEVLYV